MPFDPTRVQELFLRAVEVVDDVDVAAMLDRECATDIDLRQRVETLLAANRKPAPILLRSAAGAGRAEHPTLVGDRSTDVPFESMVTQDSTSHLSIGDDEMDLSFLEPSARPNALGKLGHYEVLEVLGHGGFGIVLKAFDESLHRVVAIKVLAPQLATTSPARKRFLREAQGSAAVRHGNVVQIYSVAEKPIPYLVMEYIPGETLEQMMARMGPLEVPDVLRIGVQIARGLAAAHEIGLIHRDIKPGNILLENGVERRAKLTDFGLARAADDASLTQSGVVAGTPMYMAPEQARGEYLDQRADLFSLGSVLYVMVSGRPPFRATSTLGVLKRVAEDSPRPIREIIPETPRWLCDVITKLHAKDPAERFATAREVADLLADCLDQYTQHGQLVDESRIPVSKAVNPAGRRKAGRLVWVPVALLVAVGGFATLREGRDAGFFSNRPGNGAVSANSTVASAGRADTQGADQIRESQLSWARKLDMPVEQANSVGMRLVLIPPGQFLMGFHSAMIGNEDESPGHTVSITQPFLIGKHEVTVGEFKQFVQDTGYRTEAERGDGSARYVPPLGEGKADPDARWQTPGFDQTDNHPVVHVSWNDATAFCDWLGQREGRSYRLPTEAEWEYCCRAGTTAAFGWGDDPAQAGAFANLKDQALKQRQPQWQRIVHDWSDGFAFTAPVGQLKANAFGLHDMHGNVWEWCQDYYVGSYYSASPSADPAGPAVGTHKVLRGGSWVTDAGYCRSSNRDGGSLPANRYDHIGFRVVCQFNRPPKPALARVPFDPQEAKRSQEAWAAHCKAPVEKTNTVGMKLRFIPPGSANSSVEIERPYYLAATEVTVGQFRQFVKATGYQTIAEQTGGGWAQFGPDESPAQASEYIWSNERFAASNDSPVVMILLPDVQAFCNWLSEQERGARYRLPTPAEWGWAGRAGSDQEPFFGADPNLADGRGWNVANSTYVSHPVAAKEANAWGLFDTAGNVNEWCFPSTAQAGLADPFDPSSQAPGIARGGSFSNPPGSDGFSINPQMAYFDLGFRLLLELDESAAAPGPTQ